jgi:antitoxin VapB
MIAKVFQNGRSQAIRIPKEYRVDTKEVYIEKVGDTLIIKPKKQNKWDRFFDELDKIDSDITKDFLKQRVQPKPQEREIF